MFVTIFIGTWHLVLSMRNLLKAIYLLSVVTNSRADLRASLISTDEFRLADSHSQFLTTKTKWLSMTLTQRQNLFNEVRALAGCNLFSFISLILHMY